MINSNMQINALNEGIMTYLIETRFGDPVFSMDIYGNQLVYGTALGQIGSFNIESFDLIMLTEMTEECVRGIFISDDHVIYAAVGDLYVLVLFKNENDEWGMDEIKYEGREHSSLLCTYSQIIQHKGKICIFVIDNDKEILSSIRSDGKSKVLIINAISNEHEEYQGICFPKSSIPLDFDGQRLLWIEEFPRHRELKLTTFNPLSHYKCKHLDKHFGHLSQPFLLQDSMIFVHNYKEIKSMDLLSGEFTAIIGIHSEDIVCIFPILFPSQVNPNGNEENEGHLLTSRGIVIAADKKGIICLWQDGNLLEKIDLCCLEGFEVEARDRLFGMGYPYVIRAGGIWIAVSTDIGIIILKSNYLKQNGGIESTAPSLGSKSWA
ncbi:unnamed protein product [Blepharisma stoltei]|uniref:Uncharacterized protein n=1 Tax=Blepharisma stoltei TaxID=1481888 RepID=A0AAU9JC74_9CILI|nr:unnamed protein product [Blepharisma stoltei]